MFLGYNQSMLPSAAEPSEANDYLAGHIEILRHSLKHWTGCGLVEELRDPIEAARRLYFAPFALLSHGCEEDPLINYANHAAQEMFEMTWQEIIGRPSRLTAGSEDQGERGKMLQRVAKHGFTDNYSGVRISKSGRPFFIHHATVWNLLDENGRYCGQAAMFSTRN